MPQRHTADSMGGAGFEGSPRALAGLTHEVPLAVGDVATGVRLLHLQVQRPPPVRPGPELELAVLHVEGEPAHVDGAGALEDAWRGDRGEGPGRCRDAAGVVASFPVERALAWPPDAPRPGRPTPGCSPEGNSIAPLKGTCPRPCPPRHRRVSLGDRGVATTQVTLTGTRLKAHAHTHGHACAYARHATSTRTPCHGIRPQRWRNSVIVDKTDGPRGPRSARKRPDRERHTQDGIPWTTGNRKSNFWRVRL